MDISKEIEGLSFTGRLDVLARQIVEGYMSGLHKSPFHGFSSEFAEHKMYNTGESTRHIDWRLYARTGKMYTRRYEEETNLRCHLIIDNSASMYYPVVKELRGDYLNKIGFSVLASAALLNLLKRQRDAAGLSIYSDTYSFYAPEKGNDRHFGMLVNALEQALAEGPGSRKTDTVTYLHQIAEKLHRRSLVFLFTDMYQASADKDSLFGALRHLTYNKHEVVLVHVTHNKTEKDFEFDDRPGEYIDVETGEKVALFARNVQEAYRTASEGWRSSIREICMKYRISYVDANVEEGVDKILSAYLIERKRVM